MQRRLSAGLLATARLVAGPLSLVRAAVPNDSSALRDAVTVAGMPNTSRPRCDPRGQRRYPCGRHTQATKLSVGTSWIG